MEKGQVFEVEIDGVEKSAELIDTIEYEGAKYAVYFTENGNNTNEIFVSKVIKDTDGYDELVDVTDPKVKEYVMSIIQESLNS